MTGADFEGSPPHDLFYHVTRLLKLALKMDENMLPFPWVTLELPFELEMGF